MASAKLNDLVEELLSDKPRLAVVQSRMKLAGLKPGRDLLRCLETTMTALEARKSRLKKQNKVENEIG